MCAANTKPLGDELRDERKPKQQRKETEIIFIKQKMNKFRLFKKFPSLFFPTKLMLHQFFFHLERQFWTRFVSID